MYQRKYIFVDASAWIAIVSERDNRHIQAKGIYLRELKNDSIFFISNWTIYEAFTKLKSDSGIEKAENLKEIIQDINLVKPIYVTNKIENQALTIFWQFRDKTWGIVDITSFLIMEECHCNFAFAFDKHFEEAASQYPTYQFTLLK